MREELDGERDREVRGAARVMAAPCDIILAEQHLALPPAGAGILRKKRAQRQDVEVAVDGPTSVWAVDKP